LYEQDLKDSYDLHDFTHIASAASCENQGLQIKAFAVKASSSDKPPSFCVRGLRTFRFRQESRKRLGKGETRTQKQSRPAGGKKLL